MHDEDRSFLKPCDRPGFSYTTILRLSVFFTDPTQNDDYYTTIVQ